MVDHIATLERVMASHNVDLDIAPGNYRALTTLLAEGLGSSYNFKLYKGETLVQQHVADLRSPLVTANVELVSSKWPDLRLEMSKSLYDKLPFMVAVLLASIVLCAALLYLLYNNMYLRWKALNRREESERNKLKIVSELGSNLIWSTDSFHRITETTQKPGKESLSVDMAGKCLWELPTLIPDRPWSGVMRTMDERLPLSCKIRHVLHDNQLYLEFLARPVFDSAGRFNGYIGIIRDISYVLDRERSLVLEKVQLTRMVDERSIDLMQAKLAAEEANLTKSRFLSTMSHEIRTPLNSIIGLTNLLLKTSLNFKQREYVETVIRSSELLLGIINDILDLSRIESGHYELVENEFTIRSLLNDVSGLVRQRALGKGLEVIHDIEPALFDHTIIGDQQRLSQALLNYLSNAIKFTDTGHILIKVTAQHPAEPDAKKMLLMFSVKDTGIGITLEDQKKLFSLFSQVDNNYTRKFEGTGLGLYIVKNIANLMGGDVGMSSKPGFGSTFWFSAAVKAGAPCNKNDNKNAADTPASAKGLRIVAVDDNEGIRFALHAGLTYTGMDVTCVASGEAALDLLRQREAAGQPVQVVILDWHLPGKSGVHFAQEIRMMALESPPAIACLTARDVNEMLPSEQKVFDQILTKPFDTISLRNVLVGLCTSGKPNSPNPSPPAEAPVSARPFLAGKKVLVVDDDMVNLKLASHILSTVGMRCTSCSNGKEAVTILENDNTFNIVLMDIEMPELDGLSAIRLIRQMPQLGSIRIYVITAHALESDLARIRPQAVDGIITKPYTAGQLIAFLEQDTTDIIETAASAHQENNQRILLGIFEQLRTGDPLVCDNVKWHMELLRSSLFGSFQGFEQAIRGYDFEKALQLLEPCVSRETTNEYKQRSAFNTSNTVNIH